MGKQVDNFWVKVISFQLRNRLLIMIILTVLSICAFYSMFTKLKIKTDFFEFYPPKHQYIKVYNQFRKMFGSANVLTIILERTGDGDLYNPVSLKKVDDLTLGILKIKGCNPLQVSSIAHPRVKRIELSYQGIGMYPLMTSVPKTKEECENFRNIVYSTEGVRGFYISPDDKKAIVSAGFWEEGVDLSYLFNSINKLTASIEDNNHKCHIAGYPMLYAWVNYYRHETYIILSVTAMAMLFLLIAYFRKIGAVMIPVLSGLVSGIWGLGFAAAIGINIDPLLLVVPLLLSARALSHSWQCLERFHQEFQICGDKEKALLTAYSALYPPALLAIVTDGLGILSISVSTIPLMQKLAYFSSFWIISILVSVIILNPVIISYFYTPLQKGQQSLIKDNNLSLANKKNIYSRFNYFIYRLSGHKAKWVCMATALIIIIGGGFISTCYLKVGDSSAGGSILYPDHPYNHATNIINTSFAGASRLVVVIEGKEKEAIQHRDSLMIMDKLGTFMQHKIPNVGGTLSLADLVRKVYRIYHEGNPKWDMVPRSSRDLAQVFFSLSANMVPGEMDQFVSLPDYSDSNVTAFLRGYNHDSIKNAINDIKKFKQSLESDPNTKINIRVAAGILGILAAVNEEVGKSYWIILILIFSTTFIFCAITYHSLKAALILIIPLAVSQVLCELLMLIFHIDLNISSLPVTAIGVGVGIDYGIYLMSRLKEECLVSDDFDSARLTTLITTGKVIMLTALTLVMGVGFWLFSIMKFSAEMGLLILLLMIFNMFSALILIPALSGIIKPNFVKAMGKGVVA